MPQLQFQEDKDEWVTNLQLTTWICLWVILIKVAGSFSLQADSETTCLVQSGIGVGLTPIPQVWVQKSLSWSW